jgi:hypothetical protein
MQKAINASAAASTSAAAERLVNAQNESRRIDFQFQQQDQQNKMMETMLKLFAERKFHVFFGRFAELNCNEFRPNVEKNHDDSCKKFTVI